MLSGFSFLEPKCIHIPVNLEEFELKCGKDQFLSHKTEVGVVDNAAADYINQNWKHFNYSDNEFEYRNITITRDAD